MKNIGIMGGTFDPIHYGHLLLAQRTAEEADLDEIWFMPAGQPPHKPVGAIAGPRDRREMIRLAIESNPRFKLSDIELEREGVSYTIDTARSLLEDYPDCRFHWIIGADMIAFLPMWHRIEELIRMIRFIGLNRPGYEQAVSTLPAELRSAVRMIEAPFIDISSTEVRDRIASGKSIKYMLPESVEYYIQHHQLYVK